MRVVLAAAGLVVLAAAGAPAQEAVVFKPYAYQKGDVTRTTKTEDTTAVSAFAAMGKEQKKNEKKKKTVVYTTRVLHVGSDPAKPEKVVRTYEKAVEVSDGAESKLALDGLAVSIERTGKSYTFLMDDGTKLPEKAAAELDREFNKKGTLDDRDVFPKGGVKVGDTWDLTAKFLKEMDNPDNPFVVAPKGAVVTGKLLGTTKKGSTTLGDVSVTADLQLTELRGKLPLKLNPGSSWKIAMKGTGAMDGTSPEGQMAATMKIALTGTVQGIDVKIDSDVKMTTKTERVK